MKSGFEDHYEPIQPGKPGIVKKREYLRLVDAAFRKGNERLSLLLQTVCSSGIRISELKYVTVEAVQKGKAEIECKGRIRTVLLTRQLCNMLAEYAKRKGIMQGMIFITRRGNALDRSNIWREMKALSMAAGVESDKIFPHNLRHLFARTYYEIEKDLSKLADILGTQRREYDKNLHKKKVGRDTDSNWKNWDYWSHPTTEYLFCCKSRENKPFERKIMHLNLMFCRNCQICTKTHGD